MIAFLHDDTIRAHVPYLSYAYVSRNGRLPFGRRAQRRQCGGTTGVHLQPTTHLDMADQ